MTVKVYSFSILKGLPEFDPEEGLVYLIDCRGLPDPADFPEYAGTTGLDARMEKFFTGRKDWLEKLCKLLDPTVDLLRQAMTADDVISIYFGCHGGHHRSVYCAHRLAEFVKRARKDVTVIELHLVLEAES